MNDIEALHYLVRLWCEIAQPSVISGLDFAQHSTDLTALVDEIETDYEPDGASLAVTAALIEALNVARQQLTNIDLVMTEREFSVGVGRA